MAGRGPEEGEGCVKTVAGRACGKCRPVEKPLAFPQGLEVPAGLPHFPQALLLPPNPKRTFLSS